MRQATGSVYRWVAAGVAGLVAAVALAVVSVVGVDGWLLHGDRQGSAAIILDEPVAAARTGAAQSSPCDLIAGAAREYCLPDAQRVPPQGAERETQVAVTLAAATVTVALWWGMRRSVRGRR